MKELVIFDCDGVLVDSEILSHECLVQSLSDLGYDISLEECLKRYNGVNDDDLKQILQQEGLKIPDDFFSKSKKQLDKLYDTRLELIIENTLAMLKSRNTMFCIASNSPKDRVLKSLEKTGLMKYFSHETIFVADDVEKGKPEPDIHLHVANKMNVQTNECIIVEDSVPGIKAAIAAKIDVVGFLGGKHAKYDWYEEKTRTFDIPIAKSDEELLAMFNRLVFN